MLLFALASAVTCAGLEEQPEPSDTRELSIHNPSEIFAFLASIAREPERCKGHEDIVSSFLELRASLGTNISDLSDAELKKRSADVLEAAIRRLLPIRKDDALKTMDSLSWHDGRLLVFLEREEHEVVEKYLDRLNANRYWFLVHEDYPKLLERLRSASTDYPSARVTKQAPRNARGCGTVILRSQELTGMELAPFFEILTKPGALSVAREYTTGCHDPAGTVEMESDKESIRIKFLLDPGKVTIWTETLQTGGYELSTDARKEIEAWFMRAIGYDITSPSPPVDQDEQKSNQGQ